MKVKFSQKSLNRLTLFLSLTGNLPRFYFNYGGTHLYVLSESSHVSKSSLRRLFGLLRGKVRLLRVKETPGQDEIITFIKKLIYPLRARKITYDAKNGILILHTDLHTKARLRGRNSARLKELSVITSSLFGVKQVKVF